MNVFAKRPQLFSANSGNFLQRETAAHYNNYEEESDELGIDEGDFVDEEDEPDYDAENELQYRRAELDNRLKNTFESIFAKYERDFDGIGDEIDLRTGKVVVNNGHLADMRDERDAGLRKRRGDPEHKIPLSDESLQESSDEQEILDSANEDEDTQNDESDSNGNESVQSQLEDDEEVYEDGDDDGEEVQTNTETSMDDDDLILRGFTQANRFIQAQSQSEFRPAPRAKASSSKLRPPITNIPSAHLDILDQFGPELGPQIVGYITHQEEASRETHIEPAWRVPHIPAPVPKFNPVPRNSLRASTHQRDRSPETSTSIWAAPRIGRPHVQSTPYGPKKVIPTVPAYISHGVRPGSKPAQSTRIRNSFTQSEDEVMLEYITKAQQQGTLLSSTLLWKGLAAQYPRHSWASWRKRYQLKFYISEDSNAHDEEDDDQNSIVDHDGPSNDTDSAGRGLSRPRRDRKPVQKDSKIITWSQAVNTIASIDPELHAGLQADATRVNNGETSWLPEQRQPWSFQRSLNERPVSRHEIDELQWDYPRSGIKSNRRNDDRFTEQNANRPTSFSHSSDNKRVPCPHINCRGINVKKYWAKQRFTEHASELVYHLLHEHQVTPFPCLEIGCDRENEYGFFKQQDLINHVKTSHPSAEAWRRLCDRVGIALLPTRESPAYVDLTDESPGSKIIKQSGSEVESIRPSKVVSRDGIVSGFDHDLTTPRPTNERTPRMSVSTPLTSFSSLAVNHSAVPQQRTEVRDSLEPESSFTKGLVPSQYDYNVSRGSPDLGELNQKTTRREAVEPPETDDMAEPMSAKSTKSQKNINNILQPAMEISSSRIITPSASIRTPDQCSGKSKVDSTARSTLSASMAIPPIPQQPGPATTQSKGHIASIPRSKSKALHMKETFTRNTVPPSHEFSDEDEPIVPSTIAGPARGDVVHKPLAAQKELLPSTPSSRKHTIKNPLHRVLAQEEEMDELSLGPDDFKIISSHTKAIPQTTFGATIKRETSVMPIMPTNTTTRKRRFSEILAAEEVDELGADECFGRSTGPAKRIKREVDLDSTPMVHRIKVQRKKTKKDYREEARKSGIDLPPHLHSSSVHRAGTPLLDLTPNSRVVQDSEDIPSSSHSHLNRRQIDDFDGLLTPTRSNHPSKVAPVPIVVKTPGGTYRKCGEGRFRCGRSFCFRCGR